MAAGPKLLICSVFAIFGPGCATPKDALWFDQPDEVASPHLGLQDGPLSPAVDGEEHTGRPDATPRTDAGGGEVAIGPQDAKSVDRGVKLARWGEQDPATTAGSASGSAAPASQWPATTSISSRKLAEGCESSWRVTDIGDREEAGR